MDQIHPEYVMSEINNISSDDAIYTVDTGMTCVWGARYLQATGKRHMLGSFNHGSMANALPQAIGAALACPDRQVIALCGDGGLSMTLGDLETVVQYKLPIKIIVFNNRSLGMVKLEMEVDGLPDWQTDMLNPNFAQVAEAMGMTGFNVSDPEEVLNTLCNAFELEGPVLINVMTDPNALAMPPKIELGQMVGFAQSMYKLLINGRSQEVIDTINSNFKHIREVLFCRTARQEEYLPIHTRHLVSNQACVFIRISFFPYSSSHRIQAVIVNERSEVDRLCLSVTIRTSVSSPATT